jgi:hypothetical protein
MVPPRGRRFKEIVGDNPLSKGCQIQEQEICNFKRRFEKKDGRVSLFVGQRCSLERDNKHYLKFHMAKVVFLIYSMILWMMDFGGWITGIGALGISCCFRA